MQCLPVKLKLRGHGAGGLVAVGGGTRSRTVDVGRHVVQLL